MGLGLAHRVFEQSNAILALSGVFKFSAKNIAHCFYCFYACFTKSLYLINEYFSSSFGASA